VTLDEWFLVSSRTVVLSLLGSSSLLGLLDDTVSHGKRLESSYAELLKNVSHLFSHFRSP
jgi:hypothetical protein